MECNKVDYLHRCSFYGVLEIIVSSAVICDI